MTYRWDYVCVACGWWIFRANGDLGQRVSVDVKCLNRMCRTTNTLWLDKQQEVTNAMQARWAEAKRIREAREALNGNGHSSPGPGMPTASRRATLAN